MVKVRRTTKASAVKSTTRKSRVALPTTPTQPAVALTDYILFFYGPPGVGKTSFVRDMTGADRVFFLSTDRGTRFFKGLRLEITSIERLNEILDELLLPKNKGKYDAVCVDHVDDICMMLETEVCDQLSIESLGDAKWGKGWKAFRKSLQLILAKLKALDSGIVFVAHETIKTVRSRAIEIEKTMPDLMKSAWKTIIPICDLVGYCGFSTTKIGGKRKQIRVLYTDPEESLYAKDRTTRRKPRNYDRLKGSTFAATFQDG